MLRCLALLASLGSMALLPACTRVLVPLGTQVALPPSTAQVAQTMLASGKIPEGPIVYSVFGIAEGEQLLARQPAGVTSTVVAELPGDARELRLTGQTTTLGSSSWVEIEVEDGGTGWVNLWNVTEDIPGDAFCDDPRVPALVDSFFTALRERSGEALPQLVSPRRGLVLRHDWWNDEIVIPVADLGDLMRRMTPIDWGLQRGSDAPIVGSFRERMLPELDALLAAEPSQGCNQLLSGETGLPAMWPEEYARLNYLSLYVPAPDAGPRFNWRTWAVGVEYVDGVPYIAILIRYQGDF